VSDKADTKPSTGPDNRNVYQRINAVRQAVGYVKKDSTVKQGGSYKAVSHDAVVAACRASMVEHGVLCVPSYINQSGQMVDTGTVTSSGTPIMRYEAEYIVSFVNCDDPADAISITVPAHAMDTGDKAPGKALSYATKYAMLKIYTLESGEEDESRVEGNRPRISADQVAEVEQAIKDAGADRDKFLSWVKTTCKASSLDDLTQPGFDYVMKVLQAKIKKQEANK